MASDGCREVEWVGLAFPYLLHHPNAFLKTENYGSKKAGHGHEQGPERASSSSDTTSSARTGTWNGPAPRGAGAAALAAATAAPAIVSEPRSVLLNNGLRIPMLGLGTYQISDPEVVSKALELGYRHFDCAAFYGNQSVIGDALKPWIAAAPGRRQELFITSKIWNTEHRPEAARASLMKTLQELGVDYLDLLLIHWPEAWTPDSDLDGAITADEGVTLLDTWRALESFVDEGLVRSIGVSNCSLPQVEQLLECGRIKPSVNQVELHPLLAQRKLVGVSWRKGVVSVGYAPWGGQTTKEVLEHPLVKQIAEETGKTPAQVLLKYNMQRGVPVIPKSSSPYRLEENIEGAFSWRLSNAQKAALDALDCGKRFIDYTWKNWGDVEEGGVPKPSRVLV